MDDDVMDRSLFDLTGLRAVVTGGARGIGRAAVVALARAGADVTIFDVLEPTLNQVGDELRSFGANVEVVVGDAERESDITALVDQVKQPQPPDIIVNNLGATIRRPIAKTGYGDIERLMRINFRPAFQLTQALIPGMVERQSGKIINVGSLGQQFGLPDRSAYTITKSALAQYGRALAVELGQYGICANTVAPGYIRTNLTESWLDDDTTRKGQIIQRVPLQRIGGPSDVAGVFVFLASSAANYVTGQTIFVDGGWSAV